MEKTLVSSENKSRKIKFCRKMITSKIITSWTTLWKPVSEKPHRTSRWGLKMWLSMSKSCRNSDHKEILSMISSRRHIKEKRLDRLTLNELTFRLRRRTSFCSVIVIYTSLWYFRSRHNKAGCIKMTRLYQSHLTNIHKGAVSSSNNHTHCNKSLKKIQSPQTISNKCLKTTRCRLHFQPRSFTKTAPTSGFTQ